MKCLLFFSFFSLFASEISSESKEKLVDLVSCLIDSQEDQLILKAPTNKNASPILHPCKELVVYEAGKYKDAFYSQYLQTDPDSLTIIKNNKLEEFEKSHKFLCAVLQSKDLKNFNLEKYFKISSLYDWVMNKADGQELKFLIELAKGHLALRPLSYLLDKNKIGLFSKKILNKNFNHPKYFELLSSDEVNKVILPQSFTNNLELPCLVNLSKENQKSICWIQSDHFPYFCKKHNCLISLEYVKNETKILIRDLNGRIKYVFPISTEDFVISFNEDSIFALSHNKKEIYRIFIKSGTFNKIKFNFKIDSYEVTQDKKILICPEKYSNVVYLVDYNSNFSSSKIEQFLVGGVFRAFDVKGQFAAYQKHKKRNDCNLTIIDLNSKKELDLSIEFCNSIGKKISFLDSIDGIVLKVEGGLRILNPRTGRSIIEFRGQVGSYVENSGFLIVSHVSSSLKKFKFKNQKHAFNSDNSSKTHFCDEYFIISLQNGWFTRVKTDNLSSDLAKYFAFSKKDDSIAVCINDGLELIENGKSVFKVPGRFFYPKFSDDTKKIFVMKKQEDSYFLFRLKFNTIKDFADYRGERDIDFNVNDELEVDISPAKKDQFSETSRLLTSGSGTNT